LRFPLRTQNFGQKIFSFTIRIVRNEEQLNRAVDIRAKAYSRHFPEVTTELQRPERQDRDPSSLIFLAESKADGTPVGTMRVDTNLASDLALGPGLALPNQIRNSTIAYVTRLGVQQGTEGQSIKLALFKALHRYCLAKQLAWMLVGIKPPGDRDYIRLGFQDILQGGQLIPLSNSWGIPVRVMAFEVISAERRWKEAKHPLYDFMFTDFHPDIEVFSSVSGMWTHPRKDQINRLEERNVLDELGFPLV
jgi:hypothetical protein